MLTHVHGNLLNVSDLARSLGVSSHTIANDLDVLEATFMIRRLQPYHVNIRKRLTKSPNGSSPGGCEAACQLARSGLYPI
jgi:uncharacterized protein